MKEHRPRNDIRSFMTQTDFYTLLPLTILTVWACVLLLVDLFIPKDRKGITAVLAAFGLAVTLALPSRRSVAKTQASPAW